MADTPFEHWAEGDAYEHFMGRWSRDVAVRFLAWLPVGPDQRWLDVGCGTGALTRAVSAFAQPRLLAGLDPSLSFVQYADRHIHDAAFVVATGDALPVMGGAFDAVISGLALNFMPQPHQALAAMRRAARAGGQVAAYVWDYAGKMEFLRYFWDAAQELDVRAATMHEGHRFPLCQPDPLRQLWQQAGFSQVSVDALDIPTVFDSFESYWQPFTVGNFPAPNYALSLSETQRNALRARIQAALPTAADGSIHLIARVWAVRGYR